MTWCALVVDKSSRWSRTAPSERPALHANAIGRNWPAVRACYEMASSECTRAALATWNSSLGLCSALWNMLSEFGVLSGAWPCKMALCQLIHRFWYASALAPALRTSRPSKTSPVAVSTSRHVHLARPLPGLYSSLSRLAAALESRRCEVSAMCTNVTASVREAVKETSAIGAGGISATGATAARSSWASRPPAPVLLLPACQAPPPGGVRWTAWRDAPSVSS
mmetsp:Transcript_17386/g.56904  ORF Transcript_17386/g.56904 Transcript_17386/m.56904 type:complete len:223 (-) Transcript_17386:1022-1690(-)